MKKTLFNLEVETLVLLIAWLLIVTLNVVQRLIAGVIELDQWNSGDILKFPITILLVGTFLLLVWIIPGFNWIIKAKNSWKYLFFTIHGIIYGFTYLILVTTLYGFLIGDFNSRFPIDLAKEFFASGFHNILKNYIFLTAILFAFNYFKSREKTILTKNKIEQELIEVKHNELKAKLQPHFLFNALNGIVALIEENKSKAQKSLIDLSDLLRYSIDIKPNKLIPIQEEIALLKKYLSIEKARYEDQLEIKWIRIKSDDKFLVPAMILQPIGENSIKHGFKKINRNLKLIIEIDEKEKVIIIKNDGNPLVNRPQNGLGLKLIKQRLNNHFPKTSSFHLYQENNWIVSKIMF